MASEMGVMNLVFKVETLANEEFERENLLCCRLDLPSKGLDGNEMILRLGREE